MKICLLGPVYPYRGGIAHHTGLLAHALAGKHDLKLISFSSQYPAWLYPGKSDRDPGPPSLKVQAEYLLSSTNPLTWGRTLRCIRDFDPEVVIIPWWTTFWAPAFGWMAHRLRKLGKSVIFLIHNTMPHEARWFDRSLTRLVLRQGSAFITQADRERERLVSLLPQARVVSVTHPIYDQFGERIPQVEARRRLDLVEDRPVLLFFGFVRPYKGLKYLIESLKHPDLSGLHPQLIVAGEIWKDKDQYLQMIDSLGLTTDVHLLDRYIPDTELSVLFSAADVFVAPYIDGSQSGSLKMAFGFGLPVVATDVIVDSQVREMGKSLLTVVPPAQTGPLAQGIAAALLHKPETPPEPLAGEESWQALVRAIEELA